MELIIQSIEHVCMIDKMAVGRPHGCEQRRTIFDVLEWQARGLREVAGVGPLEKGQTHGRLSPRDTVPPGADLGCGPLRRVQTFLGTSDQLRA